MQQQKHRVPENYLRTSWVKNPILNFKGELTDIKIPS